MDWVLLPKPLDLGFGEGSFLIDLKIDHEWFKWHPKRGRNKGKEFYCCKIIEPKDSSIEMQHYGYDSMNDIIISRITKSKLYMHKGQITEYQLSHNCKSLSEDEKKNVEKIEKKFTEYRNYWILMRERKIAKWLLQQT